MIHGAAIEAGQYAVAERRSSAIPVLGRLRPLTAIQHCATDNLIAAMQRVVDAQ